MLEKGLGFPIAKRYKASNMQATLFETAKQINLTEELVAVNFHGRWEVYEKDENGLECFSHFATPGESLQFYLSHRLTR
jgi:hypothetical protein